MATFASLQSDIKRIIFKTFDRSTKSIQKDRPRLKPEQRIPQFETAITRNSASCSQLFEVLHRMNNGGEDERIIYRAYHPFILAAFEKVNGDIVCAYQSTKTNAGVILTELAFFTHYDFRQSKSVNEFKAQELLMKCDRLAIEARRFLSGPDLQTCSELIYSAAENLLQFIDNETANDDESGEIDNMLKLIDEQLDFAETYHREVLPIAYQRDYYIGMLRGLVWLFGVLVLILIVIGILFWTGVLSYVSQEKKVLEYEILMASLIGGGLGAIVSMMSRLSAGNVDLKGMVGPTALQRVGTLRPFIGAIFGAVTYAAIDSGLIPFIEPNVESSKKMLLFAALGFVAGFSERWAPDMLSVAVGGLNGSAKEKNEQDLTKSS